MTYKGQVKFKWWLATGLFFVGILIMFILASFFFQYYIDRYMKIPDRDISLIRMFYYCFIFLSYITAWAFRGIYVISIETCIARMSPTSMVITRNEIDLELQKRTNLSKKAEKAVAKFHHQDIKA